MNASANASLLCHRLAAVGIWAALIVLISSTAWAQFGDGPLGANGRSARAVANTPEKAPEPPPDAIPGAKQRVSAAPPTKQVGDMEPTDALFDAINRGDIAAARDALNRGADLNGVNILGMTPMELSVDLGRNDISFLLLSMRGEDSNRGSRALGREAPPAEPVSKSAHAGKLADAAKANRGKGRPMVEIPVAAKPVAKPRLFANDGGTPLPSAGFLGFDSRGFDSRSAPN